MGISLHENYLSSLEPHELPNRVFWTATTFWKVQHIYIYIYVYLHESSMKNPYGLMVFFCIPMISSLSGTTIFLGDFEALGGTKSSASHSNLEGSPTRLMIPAIDLDSNCQMSILPQVPQVPHQSSISRTSTVCFFESVILHMVGVSRTPKWPRLRKKMINHKDSVPSQDTFNDFSVALCCRCNSSPGKQQMALFFIWMC